MTLGIDIGTHSSKAVLTSNRGSVLVTKERPHSLSVPKAGYAEHDADDVWWNDLVVLCRTIIEKAGSLPETATEEIDAIAVSAIAPCVLPVDRQGKPLRPAILYGVDTRAQNQIAFLNGTLGEQWIRDNCGADLSSQSAGPKIRWVRDVEPEIASRAWKYMSSATYLVFRLTGAVVLDHYTAAFFDPLYDLTEQRWNTDLPADLICSRDQLPELLWTSEAPAVVSKDAAAETGLRAGVPVTVGTADAAAEAVGAGIVGPGETMLMYGSSMFLISVDKRLGRPGRFWTAPYLFPETFALAAGMSTTGSLTQWFRKTFLDLDASAAYHVLAEEAAKVAPGSDGVIALPYFSGERTPINDPDARGVFAGLSLSTTRGHLYRAILEGVGYGIRHNLEEIENAGHVIEKLTAVGGGTRNDLWIQIVSDILGRTQTVRESAGAAFGDTVLAALSCGILDSREEVQRWIPPATYIRPDPSATPIYDSFYKQFRDLYEVSAPVVHNLVETSRELDRRATTVTDGR